MPEGRWRPARWHWVVLLLALALRAGFAWRTPRVEALYLDGREYVAYARSLLAGRWDGYRREFNVVRPPLLPLLLVPCVAADPDGVRLIQVVQVALGTLQVPLLAAIASRWAGRRAGDRALVLAAFHPFLVYFTAFVVTEPLFILLLWTGMAALLLVDREPDRALRWTLLAGVAMGLACLTRPALQPFLVPAVFWIGRRVRPTGGLRRAVAAMALFTIATSAFMVPWMLRNLAVHGEPSLAPGNAQQVFSQGNGEAYLRVLEARTQEEFFARHDEMTAPFYAEGGDPRETWVSTATRFIRDRPGDWLRLQWKKTVWFWTPWLDPTVHSPRSVALSAVGTVPLFLLAALEVRRRWRRPDPFGRLLAWLVVIGWLTGGFLFHVAVRYRIPFVDVAFLILAASWLGSRSRSPT